MNLKRIAALFLALLMLAGTAGCGSGGSKTSKKEIAATVNGEAIYMDEYNQALDRMKKSLEASGNKVNKEMLAQLQKQALEQLIMIKVETQEAKKKDLLVTDDKVERKLEEMKAIYGNEANFQQMLKGQGMTLEEYKVSLKYQLSRDALFSGLTKNVKVTDADVEKYYKQSPQETAKLKVRMILVSKEKRSDAEAKAAAEGIIKELDKGTSFEKLAKTKSDDAATKANGGLIANPAKKGDFYVSRGQIGGAAESVAFTLKAGEYTKTPIPSPQGYMIIKVEEVKKTPLKEVKEILTDRILQMKKNTTYNEFVQKARQKAKIEIKMPIDKK